MLGSSVRAALIMAMSAALCGCMFITHDKTDAPGMDALVGRSYVTVQNAFLIKDSCIGEFKARNCAQLQVALGHYYVHGGKASGSGWQMLRLPADPQALAATPVAATRLTWVPKGTPVTIVRLVSRSMGQYRRCWVVYGTLPGLPADTVAELPACNQWAPESEPQWFHPQPVQPPMKDGKPVKTYGPVVYDYLDQPPLPDPALLIPAPTH